MDEGHSVAVLMPKIEEQDAVVIAETIIEPTFDSIKDGTPYKRTDPLNYVIQKLSKLVENEKSKRCVLIGKRSHSDSSLSIETGIRDFPAKNIEVPPLSPPKKVKKDTPAQDGSETIPQQSKKTVCYQCSLCKSICASFELLSEHIKQHGENNEVILMCSECHYTSKQQEELEAHIRNHYESNKPPVQSKVKPQQGLHLSNAAFQGVGGVSDRCITNRRNWDCNESHTPTSTSVLGMGIKKWYTYEQYGMYRCLICSYTCGQQRMLKTHAWKHAGEVDCSYPVFEDENEPASLPDSTVAQTPQGSEAVVLSLENKVCPPNQRPLQVQMSEHFSHQLMPNESIVQGTQVLSHPDPPTVTAEIVLEEETMSDIEQDNVITDSLLSSAQKIINCSENTKGHVNVIVERLPSAEETVLQKPFIRSADIEVEKKLISEASELTSKEYVYHAEKNAVELEEIFIGWCHPEKQESDLSPSEGKAANENIPPARRRTNSESLRLHSLAAEALVTMPIRAAELTRSSFKGITEVSSKSPDTGQRPADANCSALSKIGPSVKNYSDEVNDLNWINPELVDIQRHKPDFSEVPVKMGISMSLLTVIEKLRERTDQNATDEDILKELQDNAQCQTSTDADFSGTDLVEYIPNTDRPYRCRLCHYSSGNKGYIKQHLRVHRQRQPYQCPICEHKAEDSKDLESHMINHCKTRMYQCKQCEESFYYKSQLRNHERDQHSLQDAVSAASESSPACNSNVEGKSTSEAQSASQKFYKCDVCEYTSISYIGVRNHRRIHNSDKPYRCRICDFATTNMNSLKCHMKRHPQEHQAVELMEQYKCSLCGYVCSHPPSLKSHMWKHASDQNYNYEQVNKAINDAISQSSRVQEETQSSVQDGADDMSESFFQTPENLMSLSELASQTRSEMVTSEEVQKGSILRNVVHISENSLAQPRPSMEYCVLLFCCCICGFESTSKELLMDHMKEHEGEIINIILNKDQNAAQSTI
ncbi:zinc finger protein 507 [Pleurodeles waltl]